MINPNSTIISHALQRQCQVSLALNVRIWVLLHYTYQFAIKTIINKQSQVEHYPLINFLFIPYFREPSSVQKLPLSLRHLLSILVFHLVNNNQCGIVLVSFENYRLKTQGAHKDFLCQKKYVWKMEGSLNGHWMTRFGFR